jgi:hypothetical protein
MRSAAASTQTAAASAPTQADGVSDPSRAATPYGICTPRRRKALSRTRSFRQRKLPAGLCLALLALLALSASSAQAAITHPYTGTSFGPGGVGVGSFGNVQGVAVEQSSGDVLVYDRTEGGRVYKFNAAGEPVDFSSSGTNVIEEVGGAAEGEEEIAVDDSSGPDAGDIYVANNSVVRIYSESGAVLGELSGGEPCGVAVDPSGNVYVGFYNETTVRRYAPSTSPVTSADETGSIGGLGSICNIAVDAAGDLYAAKFVGGVTKYGALQFGSLSASGEVVDSAGKSLAVDPTSGEAFIDETNQIAQYDGSVEPPALQGITGASGEGALSGSSYGVGVDHASGEVYAGDGETVEIFGPGVVVAGASTEAASGLTGTEATLHGTVEPAGTEVTSCVFEYGTQAGAFDHSAPCEPAAPYTGNASIAVTAHLAGLSAGTVYRYRIVASNASGSLNGAEESFSTKGPQISNVGHSEASSTAVFVHSEINPAGEATTYHVEYGASTTYGSSTQDVELEAGEAPVEVSVHVTGLQPNTTYHFRFSATNAAATAASVDKEFTTPAVVTNESFSNVGSSTASLGAEIAPGEEPTSYQVEYGTSTAYGSSTSPVSVGAGETPVPVTAHLSELQPGMTYHFRFIAVNAIRTATGPDVVFTTHALAASALPDARGYEMVTPADNQGAEPYVPVDTPAEGENDVDTGYPVAAAADGSAVSYVGSPTSGGNGNEGNGGGNQFLAKRGAGGGWSQTDIQPNGYVDPSYWAFSPDLEHAVLSSGEALTADSPPAGYVDLYTRDSTTGSYQPLFTATPPNRSPSGFSVANGVSFGERYAGASADFTHLLFEANDALTSAAVDPTFEFNNLYESVGGRLRSVNLLPDGSAAPDASFGAPELESASPVDFDHVISADGSRIFWTDMNTGSLYVREDGERTKLIAEGATYLTASADGSKVLYTKAGDLYEENLETAITRDLAPSAETLGLAGAGEDLEYVYLVAHGALLPGAVAGKSNLYLLHDGQTELIATLGEEFSGISGLYPQSNQGSIDLPWQSDIGRRTAEATRSGRSLVFMSTQSLTGYDNFNPAIDAKAAEVYAYDADSGALSCASCDPTGERPGNNGDPGALADYAGGVLALSAHPTYQLRWISEDGSRVFFQSAQPLLPQAQNGRLNVYEWERDGAGTCTKANGCIYLLSTGSSSGASYFIDASASGNDVFMMTRSQLVPADQNEYNDIYDARVDAKEEDLTTQCTGTGCQGVAASPPVFATPASATYHGVGNFSSPVTPAAKPKPKPKPKKKAACTSKMTKKSKKPTAKKSVKQAKAKPVSCKAKKAAKRVRHTDGRGGR